MSKMVPLKTTPTKRRLTFQCCYCGAEIEEGESRRHPLDPCAVVLIGNWKAADPEQLSQQFFCHMDCFRSRLNAPRDLDIDTMQPGDQA